MAEAQGKAVVCRRLGYGDFLTHFVQDLRPFFQTAFIFLMVDFHVEEGKFHLADEEHTALEVFSRVHFVEQLFRQYRAGFFVRGHLRQYVVFPNEVFHKLAGQLDRVPLDAVDAGYAHFVNLGQQVVQAVAGFVEEGDDFVVAQTCFFVAYRWGEVADEVGGRQLQRTVGKTAAAFVAVHPCAAAFAFACVQVHVNAADGLAVLFQLEIAHVFVPNRNGFFSQLDAVEFFDLGKQACQDFADREVFFHFGFAEGVFGLAQFFGGVAQIPRLRVFDIQVFARKGLDFGKVFFGKRFGAAGEVVQEV